MKTDVEALRATSLKIDKATNYQQHEILKI